MLKEVKKGDKVVVVRGGMDSMAIGIIKRVMKHFIELEDGSKWRLNGLGAYPHRRWDCAQLLEHTEELENEIRARNIGRWLSQVKYDGYSLQALQEIVALVKKYKPECGKRFISGMRGRNFEVKKHKPGEFSWLLSYCQTASRNI
jgi:hypothetical protein